MTGEESYSELKCPHCEYTTLRYLMNHGGHEMLQNHIENVHVRPFQNPCEEVTPPATT